MAHRLDNLNETARKAARIAVTKTFAANLTGGLEGSIRRVFDELMAACDPDQCDPKELLEMATRTVITMVVGVANEVSDQIADDELND